MIWGLRIRKTLFTLFTLLDFFFSFQPVDLLTPGPVSQHGSIPLIFNISLFNKHAFSIILDKYVEQDSSEDRALRQTTNDLPPPIDRPLEFEHGYPARGEPACVAL